MNGFRNEYEFCKIFDDKFIYQLDEKYIKFLEDIYEKELDRKAYVICWKQRFNNKVDIVISIGKDKKYISIKSGKNNSIHLEYLDSFVSFLKELEVYDDVIEIYKNYHIGNDENGNKISGKEYQEQHPEELKKLNMFLNKKENVERAITRFLFQGRNNEDKMIDAMIYGTPENFMYATRKQIYNYLLLQQDEFIAPHFSLLVMQPWTRNLNLNPKYENRRDFVQVKWYRLDEHFKKIHCE